MLRLVLYILLCLIGYGLYYVFRKQSERVFEQRSGDKSGSDTLRSALVLDPHTGEYHVVRRDWL